MIKITLKALKYFILLPNIYFRDFRRLLDSATLSCVYLQLHVGKQNSLCPTLQVQGTNMGHVEDMTYLGDIISADGSNKNVKNRIKKGHGKINDILTILEKTSLGYYYFKIALLLRESMFLNSILTNSDIWVGLTKSEIEEFENLDLMLL